VILAIDPGNIESGYVILNDDLSVRRKGKVINEEMLNIIKSACYYKKVDVAIEMVASYGMAVGSTVFDTCVWIGRFVEKANQWNTEVTYIYRKDEKMNLCGSMKAKDSNIVQALIDRFAPNTPNKGKGTKKEPGWFYGFKKDIWQAYAVGVTYHDMYLNGGNRSE
jgi:hypothetical protein